MEFLPFTDHDNRYSIAQVTKHLDTIVEATVPQNRRGLKLMSPAESARLGRLWLDAEERLVEQGGVPMVFVKPRPGCGARIAYLFSSSRT